MNIKLKCYHPEKEKLGLSFDMLEKDLLEFGTIVYKCPECNKEIFVKLEIKEEY